MGDYQPIAPSSPSATQDSYTQHTAMLVLLETAAGFGLFKVMKEGKVAEATDLSKDFATSEKAEEMVKLKKFSKFTDQADALAAATAMVEGKLDKNLKKFLKKNIVDKELNDELIVSDSKLAGLVKEKLDIQCLCDSSSLEVLRGVRLHMDALVPAISTAAMKQMQIGLSHSLSRHKVKFSPDKVDTMVVQAIGLLDDLDKEVNTYSMRIKEWYGWHFPEMQKIVVDNTMYAKTILSLGMVKNCAKTDLSDILPEEMESELKAAAILSMGTEISEEDLENIQALCTQTIKLMEYRTELYDYLKNRMAAIAPNLTVLVGELVGARLISHAGSLMNLAKQPAITVQILGAEKALFRALKTKKATPKYGLIYHASLIGQSAPALKGKISRVLAAKLSLCCRVDALADDAEVTVGAEFKEYVEKRLATLEEGGMKSATKGISKPDQKKFTKTASATFSAEGDAPKKKKAEEPAGEAEEAPKKKKKKVEAAAEEEEEVPKKKKKKAAAE